MDFIIKLLKFIGFIIILALLAIVFMLFGWGGLILAILIIAGARAIFGD